MSHDQLFEVPLPEGHAVLAPCRLADPSTDENLGAQAHNTASDLGALRMETGAQLEGKETRLQRAAPRGTEGPP